MNNPAPIPCRWDGESFVPASRRWSQEADKRYVVGEVYSMEPYELRSDRSHRHEFAWLKEAWRTLPERLADEFPSAEHLRKRALIDAGFHDETIIDAGSNAAALRVATLLRSDDEFAVVVVRGPMVVRRVAKSQSRRAMGAKDFQASKEAIMEVVANMLQVPVADLKRVA